MQDSFNEIYPRIWAKAYAAGEKAQEEGLSRDCQLHFKDAECAHNGVVLKVYKSAWEQGWDHYKIPDEFRQVEEALKAMPTHPMKESDL